MTPHSNELLDSRNRTSRDRTSRVRTSRDRTSRDQQEQNQQEQNQQNHWSGIMEEDVPAFNSVFCLFLSVGKTSLITRFMYDSFDNTYQVSEHCVCNDQLLLYSETQIYTHQRHKDHGNEFRRKRCVCVSVCKTRRLKPTWLLNLNTISNSTVGPEGITVGPEGITVSNLLSARTADCFCSLRSYKVIKSENQTCRIIVL